MLAWLVHDLLRSADFPTLAATVLHSDWFGMDKIWF